jgi:hypothetical protein
VSLSAATTRSAISCLLSGECPSAVLWRIRPVVVDTVDRMLLGWSRSEIGQEYGEVAPFAANGNSAPAVVGEERVVRVEASPSHGTPRTISEAFIVGASRVSVPQMTPRGDLSAQASATPRVAAFKFVAWNDSDGTARALATVCRRGAASVRDRAIAAYDGEAPEYRAGSEWL